jgi:protein required for attachment to host cells
MTGIANGTLVVVTDSEKALFLVNRTDAEDPNLEVTDKETEPNPKTSQQGTDSPGRGFDGGPDQRSGFEDTDWHDLQKERFAADLADRLYKMAHRGEFDRLVLVASPQVLGVVREHLHKEVADRLVGEIDKTLTNHPRHEIERIVASDLAEQNAA